MKIGMMSFAHMHAYSYAKALQKLENVELVAVHDEDEVRGKAAAKQYHMEFIQNMDDFLAADTDAVLICSENKGHKEMVIQAAEAGKHILCEKPIATTMEEAKQMIEVCENQNVILQIAFPVRFNSSIQHLKEQIDDGELGDIVAIRTTNRGSNPGGWFIDSELSGGGAVLDHTVHMVDIMRWYLRSEVKEVYSLIDSYFNNIAIDDAGIMTLEFENGVIATHDASWSKYKHYPTRGDVTIEVIGTKKSVSVDIHKEHMQVYGNHPKNPFNYIRYNDDTNLALMKDFVNCVENNRQPSINGYDGLKALEVALGAYESSRQGKNIRL